MDIESLLREHGIRPTYLRTTVLEILFDAGNPLSWKDTFTRFSKKRVNKVSLYRALALLEASGLVHKILGTDGVWYYCAHSPEEPRCPGNHAHFLCLSCGRMICLKEQPLPMIAVPEGYSVEGKQLLAYGHCPSCSETHPQG